MSAIPEDIIEKSRAVLKTIREQGWEGAGVVGMLSEFILAERQRCADVARRYLEDIAGCDMNDDGPDKIAAAILDPNWSPPPL